MTIDAIAGKIGHPHLVKLDIQGLELDALKGAVEIISKNNTMFFVEFCPMMLSERGCGEIEILRTIEEAGYFLNIFRAHPVSCFERISSKIMEDIYDYYIEEGHRGTLELIILPPPVRVK